MLKKLDYVIGVRFLRAIANKFIIILILPMRPGQRPGLQGIQRPGLQGSHMVPRPTYEIRQTSPSQFGLTQSNLRYSLINCEAP